MSRPNGSSSGSPNGRPSGSSSFSTRHHVGTAGGAGSLGASGTLRSPSGSSNFRSGNIVGGNLSGAASARAAGSSFAARHAANIGGGTDGSRFNGTRPGAVSGNRPTGPGSSALSGAIQRSAGTAGRIAGSSLANASSFYNRHRVGSANGPGFGGRPGSSIGTSIGSAIGSSTAGLSGAGRHYHGSGFNGANFSGSRYGSGYGGSGYNGYGGGYGRYAGVNRFGYGNYGYNRYGYGGFGGYGRYGYGYGRYGLGSTVLNIVNYGLGYGGYGGYGLGYGGWGYSPYCYGGYGYGYRPWGGYYGYPWGYIASRVLFGIRPLLGLGYGYGGYGGYSYGNNYGNTYYSTYSPVVTTEVPVVTSEVPAADPVPVDPTLAAEASDYAAQGEADFRAGNYAAAVKNWQHALVEDPNNATLVMMLSQGFFATGKYDEAAGALQAALQGVPQDKWNTVVGNYRELYGNAQDYTDQLRALETASEKTESPALQFLLGYHYGFLGFPKEAVRELDKGLKLAPEDVLAKQLRDMFAPKSSTPPAAVIPKS